MKSRIVIGGAANILALALTGCGGQNGTDTPGADALASPAVAETSALPANATDEPAARAFIDTLFAAYANDGEPNLFSEPDKTFEPELAAAIAQLGKRTETNGTIEASQEADPICACQDYGEVSHSIDTLQVDGTKAKAVVTFSNFGKAEKRTVDLVSTPVGWRIQDIDGTYRAAVMKDLGQP